MKYSPEQIKGKIKNLANLNMSDPRVLMRIFMMERFLERVANSNFCDYFIIKGGVLITAMVGVAMRTTMDIDASIKNFDLNEKTARDVLSKICSIDLGDGVTFSITIIERIMDEMNYPGLRAHINCNCGKMITPIKIDISTGDVITPREIEFSYPLLLEDRTINLWSYNIETILAEKLQTIIYRGVFNTRMRDFYDIFMLVKLYEKRINKKTLTLAYESTCAKRGINTNEFNHYDVLNTILKNEYQNELWEKYRQKYNYALDITFENVISGVEKLLNIINESD